MDKTVFVTGGSRGIGEGIVRRFYAAGDRVAFCYGKSEAQAEKLCAEMPGVCAYRADISSPGQVEALSSRVLQDFGTPDVLVCNAGIAHYGLFQDITPEEFDRLFAVNVRGVYLCCRAFMPGMIARQSGSIITISSMWGEVGASCEVAYSATKGAVIAMTKALAKELAPSHIRVNSVSPGTILTDMVRPLGAETLEQVRLDTPLEMLGEAKDVAEAVYYLASDGARFVTGQVLGVNGGAVI